MKNCKEAELMDKTEDIIVSIIIPVYNEERNIPLLYATLTQIIDSILQNSEIIFINDGSTDQTKQLLDALKQKDNKVKVIHLRRNYGQTAAIMAGLDAASGEIFITMDGDLQNDPKDIPRLLSKLNEGFDVVSGWRKERRDSRIKRNIPSSIANWLISRITGVRLHDYGCTLKAYKSSVLRDVHLYGEMHRFIPVYASWQGAKVAEITVTHHPRTHGKSKYGLERTVKVILDLIVVSFLDKYAQKPMYIFGAFGMISIGLSFLGFLLMLHYKFLGGKSFVETPLPVLVAMFFLIGTIAILMGLISEILMRTYFESQNKSTYLIEKADSNKRE